jgi:hypothetical protein
MGGTLIPAKTSIGLEQALYPGTHFRTGLCQPGLEHVGDRLLNLIAFEH